MFHVDLNVDVNFAFGTIISQILTPLFILQDKNLLWNNFPRT